MSEGGRLNLDNDQEPTEKPKKGSDQDLLDQFMTLARDRFRESDIAELERKRRMLDDRRFAGGGREQWIINGVDIQAQRWNEGKPAVTTNQIGSYTRQVTNSLREGRPGIQYVGVDDDHDPETAELLQGVARHVEQNSFADIAYDTAAEHMVEGGRGWVYLRCDYVHDRSEELEIFIKRIRNPETVFPDPTCLEFTYDDMRYLHHVEDMPLDTHNRLYPDCEIASAEMFSSIGTNASDWHWGKDRVRVSNYYYIEHVEKTLVAVARPEPEPMAPQPGGVLNIQQQYPTEIQPPELLFLEDLSDEEKQRMIVNEKGEPVARRKVKVPQPMFAKINGIKIIDGNEKKTAGRPIPGRFIPYVPFIGGERDIDGEIDLRGMVRDMREAQQMVNFWQSALTEAIGKVTHGTWIIAEGQLTDGETGNISIWRDMNRKNFAFAPYKPVSLNGTLAPPPHWESQAPEIQSIVVALQIAENKLRSCAGFQIDSEENKPEVSGRAIIARQQQGERGASHYAGNQARSVRQVGRIALHMFPDVYTKPRIMRINGVDDQENVVQVYAGEENKPQQAKNDPKTKKPIKAFDLSQAYRYDVRTSTGPSMATKRQEALSVLLELAKAVPAVGQVGCDIIVKNGDFSGAQELAKRLKKVVVPPQALDEEGDQDAQMMKMSATLQQVMSINKMLTGELNAKNDIIDKDQVKVESAERLKHMELQSKELIEQNKTLMGILKIQLDATKTAATLEAQATSQAQAQQHEADQGDQDRQFGAAQNREKLGAGMQQQQMKGQQATEQTHIKGQQAAQQVQMKGQQAEAQTDAEHLQQRVITTMDHSQQEHMAEINASQQREQQERDIEAQQQQAEMAQDQAPEA